MKLKSLMILSLAFAALPAFAGVAAKNPLPPAPAEDPLTVSVLVGFDTDYVFRGVEIAKNLVSVGIDGVYKINQDLSFNAGAWYASASEDKTFLGGGFPYSELDLYTALNLQVAKNLTVGVKYTHYAFLGDLHTFGFFHNVNEAGFTLATNDLPVDITAAAFRDFNGRGYYFETAVSKTFAITDRVSIVPAALVSYNIHSSGGYNFGTTTGWGNVKLQLGLPIKLSKTATLTPYIAENLPLDGLKDVGEHNRFYGGAALNVTF